MAQRAIWRNPPDDPKSATGWLLREGGSRSLSLPVAFALMLALGAAFLGWSPWAILALPLILLHIKLPPTPSVAATLLATVPPPGPAFECDIAILREGIVYGTDQGIVTFVDGWLYFAGRRTEFALDSVASDHTSLMDRVTLALENEEIDFRPRGGWNTAGKYDEAEEASFRRAFGVWFYSPGAREGESIFPPIEVHASGLARTWRQFLHGLAIDSAFLALMISLFGSGFFVVFLGHSFGNVSRLRRLSRLAHAQKKALVNVSEPATGP